METIVRRLLRENDKSSRYRGYCINIPAEQRYIFTTTDVVIEILPKGDGIFVKPKIQSWRSYPDFNGCVIEWMENRLRGEGGSL